MEQISAAVDFILRGPDPFALGCPGGSSVNIEILVRLSVMDSNVVIGGPLYRAPAEVEIACSGIERIPVSRNFQIRIFRVGLSYGIVGNRVIGVICPRVRRGKGQITAAALTTDQDSVRLHLCKAVEPC